MLINGTRQTFQQTFNKLQAMPMSIDIRRIDEGKCIEATMLLGQVAQTCKSEISQVNARTSKTKDILWKPVSPVHVLPRSIFDKELHRKHRQNMSAFSEFSVTEKSVQRFYNCFSFSMFRWLKT